MLENNGLPSAVVNAEINALGLTPIDPTPDGAVGRTMFDLPGDSDLGVTVLLPTERLRELPTQALVRIVCRGDGRNYLGVVSAGPFAEPDGLRGDSPLLVAVATRGGNYLPPHHGRVQVTVLGEEVEGAITPPRFRPLPNSPVFPLDDGESKIALRCGGDIRLGLAAGHAEVEVALPSDSKSVLPRHTAILGTTGGGKSTTVAGLVARARAAGLAVVLLDVEGEYTRLHEPTDDARMRTGLTERGIQPQGVPTEHMTVYHLMNRGTANPDHPNLKPFSLQFNRLSPYSVFEILGLSDAQQERFLKAFDILKEVMRECNIFPVKGNADQEQPALEIDEFERGYPRMTLSALMDVVVACSIRAEKGSASKPAKSRSKGGKQSEIDEESDEAEEGANSFHPRSAMLNSPGAIKILKQKMHAAQPQGNVISWRSLMGRLARLSRMKVFHDTGNNTIPQPIDYKKLIQPGHLSVIDLSDSGFTELNNFVIADLLRGIQTVQDEAFETAMAANQKPPRTLVVVEEAHEFLSSERIDKTPVLFEQLARIAKRGRKRWLGLTFVTQLPAHLPKQVLGLCNSFILHKLTDPHVVSLLERTVGGVDEGLWARLPNLAPGQAIASFPHFARPLLVSIDPAAARLRMEG